MQTLTPPLSPRDHVRGDPQAIVTLIEYGGYQCPHSVAVQPVVTQLLRKYRIGLRHAFRHFPLEATRPIPELVAEAAEYAASRGAFWHMHALLFARSTELTVPSIFACARRLRLPDNGLRNALATGVFASRIHDDVAHAMRCGVEGTPTFFIDGHCHHGPHRFELLVSGIDAALDRIGEPRLERPLRGGGRAVPPAPAWPQVR